MLYVKSTELKNLGINADSVLEQLDNKSALRELSCNWYRLSIYTYSYTLDEVFYVEDLETNYHSPVGSLLLVAPGGPTQATREVELKPTYDYDLPF